MATLITGLVVFFGIHMMRSLAPAWRDARIKAWGLLPYKAVFSIVAVLGLYLIIVGYDQARATAPIWYQPPQWLRHIAMATLLPVVPLLIAAYVPSRLRTMTKHPMLIATKLWALAHLFANGSAADVVLFGGFLVWADAVRVGIKRRADQGAAIAAATWRNDVMVIGAGLVGYALIVFVAHGWLTGISLFSRAV